jgi:outer membrane autotransporter protein
MGRSNLAGAEPRRRFRQCPARRCLNLAAIVVAALAGHAHAQVDPGPPSLNPNQRSMSLAIRDTSVVPFNGVCPRLTRKLAAEGSLPELENDLLVRCRNVVNEQDAGLQATALQELTAEELNAPASNAIDFSRSQRSNVAARLVTLRAGGTSLASLDEWDSLLPATSGGAAGDEAMGGRLGIFVNGTLGEGDKDETEFEAAYDFELTGFTAGVDYRFTDSLVGGIALGYAESETDFDDDGGSLDADGFTGSLFGSWYGERAYADLIVSYGSQSYDSVRNVRYTLTGEPLPIDHTATGDTDGEVTAAGLSAGYAFGSGGWRIGPTAAVSYLKVDIDGFSEQGGNNPELNLEFEDQDAKSLQLQLGLDLAYAASLSWGVLSPYARVSQVWEQENDQQTFLIRYVADPFRTADTTAAVTSDDVDDSFVLWAVGVSATFANGFACFLDYEAVSSLDTVSYGEFTLGLRYQFR